MDSKLETREKLILVAIRLFAEQGFSGVSMRTINAAAGTRNSSAVHYHFGNKHGIVKAVLDKIHADLMPLFHQIIADLKVRELEGRLQIADLLIALQLPFWVLRNTPGYGKDSVRLIARLMHEDDEAVTELFNAAIHDGATQLMQMLQALQPGKDANQVRFQLTGALMTTISGLAMIDMLDRTPFGNIEFDNNLQLLLSFINKMAFGLNATEIPPDVIDLTFWSKYVMYLNSPEPVF